MSVLGEFDHLDVQIDPHVARMIFLHRVGIRGVVMIEVLICQLHIVLAFGKVEDPVVASVHGVHACSLVIGVGACHLLRGVPADIPCGRVLLIVLMRIQAQGVFRFHLHICAASAFGPVGIAVWFFLIAVFLSCFFKITAGLIDIALGGIIQFRQERIRPRIRICVGGNDIEAEVEAEDQNQHNDSDLHHKSAVSFQLISYVIFHKSNSFQAG